MILSNHIHFKCRSNILWTIKNNCKLLDKKYWCTLRMFPPDHFHCSKCVFWQKWNVMFTSYFNPPTYWGNPIPRSLTVCLKQPFRNCDGWLLCYGFVNQRHPTFLLLHCWRSLLGLVLLAPWQCIKKHLSSWLQSQTTCQEKNGKGEVKIEVSGEIMLYC